MNKFIERIKRKQTTYSKIRRSKTTRRIRKEDIRQHNIKILYQANLGGIQRNEDIYGNHRTDKRSYQIKLRKEEGNTVYSRTEIRAVVEEFYKNMCDSNMECEIEHEA